MKWLTIDGISRRVMDEAGDDGDKGGGGNGDKKTPEQLELERLREENARLANKNTEFLNETRNLKEKVKKWDGLDPENVRSLLNRFDQDEELKLISEGKHEEVIKKRTERIGAEYKSQITAKDEELTGLRAENEGYRSQVQKLVIDGASVTAFIKEGGRESAVEDIQLRASRAFKVEKGEAIMRDANNDIVAGKNGPLTIAEWVEGLRETAPHLFAESNGAGAGGNRSKSGKTGIDAKIEAARKAGDVKELRRLREEKAKGQSQARLAIGKGFPR